MSFSQFLAVELLQPPAFAFNVRLKWQLNKPVEGSDHLLATFWLRNASPTLSGFKAQAVFESVGNTNEKSFIQSVINYGNSKPAQPANYKGRQNTAAWRDTIQQNFVDHR